MIFAMHYRAPFTKQLVLLDACQAGAAVHGIKVLGVPYFSGPITDVDGLILYGIGGMSKEIYDAYRNEGMKVVFFDKGYTRGAYLRVAVDAFQPLHVLDTINRRSDRFEKLKLDMRPYEVRGDHVLFDGASNKFCLWKGLGHWLEWGQKTVNHISMMTTYPIVYRPRPSHNNDLTSFHIAHAALSLGPSLAQEFERTRVCVSYGGNIGWDCVVAGVPHFAIGDSIARPLSQTDWDDFDTLVVPSDEERLQWLSNVAYWQWTLQEIASGEAWGYLKEHLGA